MVLTFQLKRFTNFMRKINKFVAFPKKMDLGKFMPNPIKIIYKLYAVIVHSGSSSYSGHYYAFVRRQDSWYKVS